MAKYAWEVIRHTLSPKFVRSIIFSFAYYVHEHVVWRSKIHVKQNTRIHATASVRNAQNIYVGSNSHINHLCCVWADTEAAIVLGDNLLMGPGVGLFASNHSIRRGQPMTLQEREQASIVIGDDVWLGAHSVVTAGTRIASGVVVAAGAVVTRSILEEGVIVGGVPARIIGRRPEPSASEGSRPEADMPMRGTHG